MIDDDVLPQRPTPADLSRVGLPDLAETWACFVDLLNTADRARHADLALYALAAGASVAGRIAAGRERLIRAAVAAGASPGDLAAALGEFPGDLDSAGGGDCGAPAGTVSAPGCGDSGISAETVSGPGFREGFPAGQGPDTGLAATTLETAPPGVRETARRGVPETAAPGAPETSPASRRFPADGAGGGRDVR